MAIDWTLLRGAALFSAWAVTMGTSVVAAVRAPEFLGASGPGIAALESIGGDVQIRDGGSPLWIEAVDGQQLSSGTIVATGRRARALIRFESGHDIAVSENSQVVIERPKDAGSDAIVSLVKGTVDTRVSKPRRLTLGTRRLVVQAGTQRVLLSGSEDRVTIARSPGGSVPVVKAAAGAPVQQDIGSGETRTLVAVAPSPTPAVPASAPSEAASGTEEPVVPKPVAEPAAPAAPAKPAPRATVAPKRPPPPPAVATKPPPPPRVRVFEAPRIVTPAEDVTYWTPRPLPSADPHRVPIVMSPLQMGAPGRPALEIHRKDGDPETVIASPRGVSGRLVAMVDVKRSESVVLKPTIAAGASARITITPSKEMKLRIRSLANAPKDKAVSVSLGRLAEKPGDGLIAERSDFDPKAAPVMLRLATGADLPKLAPFLRGSDGFAIRVARQPPPKTGLHVVRDGQIAASLTGDVEPDAALGLTKSLGGSLAFAGRDESYRQSLPEADSTGEIVLLTQDGVRVDLHQALLKSQAPARSIAASHGEHFFAGAPEAIFPEPTRPAAATDVPSLAAWVSQSGAPAYHRRFAFIESVTKSEGPTFLQLDADAFNAHGLFEAVHGTEALLAYQINSAAKAQAAAKPGAAALSAAGLISHLLELFGADAVVFAPPTGSWRIATVENGKAINLGSGEPPAQRTVPAEVHDWLSRVLGFDGIVLDRRGNHALAACSSVKGQAKRQGVAPAAPAIVEVVEAAGGRCLLRTLLGSPTAAGAKVQFE
jgi:hypothetical protein